MLLIAKSSVKDVPTRQAKTITIPFQTTFDANLFYVWFDTLEAGASGKAGDRIRSIYTIDGEVQGAGFGGTIKGTETKTFSFGNL